jgi:TolB protein
LYKPGWQSPDKFTNHPGGEREPQYVPDGSKIIYKTVIDDHWEIFSMNPDGTQPVNLTKNNPHESGFAISPNSRYIAYESQIDPNLNREVFIMTIEGGGKSNLSQHPDNDGDPAFQPGMY